MQVAKFLKNHLHGIEHFQSNGTSLVFLLLDIGLHFQVKIVGILLDLYHSKTVRDRTNIIAIRKEIEYSPSNGATANVIGDGLDHIFKVMNFEK